MDAVLKIYGDIGVQDPMLTLMGADDEMISAKTISAFLDQHKDATDIIVKINSRGGDVQEGWSIYDLLTTSGKKIKTIGEGKVYSIATIVFLAGEEREIMKNADGLIHNPFIPPYTLADSYTSEELQKLSDGLKQEEEKILDFYAQKTGTDKEKLRTYMDEDTKLSSEDMLSLGFATKINEPVKAYAYIKPLIKFSMEKNDVKSFGEKLDAILAKIVGLTRLPAKDQTLVDKEGKEIKLDKEAGAPVVGDKASPDGTFVMASGQTIVISGGVVTEIKEPVADKSELELANEKIAKLEAKITDAEKEKTAAEATVASYKEKEVQIMALADELKSLKNSWKPDGRNHVNNSAKVGSIDINRVRELREKSKQKSE
jgi:ATP-dependent Clp protease protease subunit